MLTVLLLGTTFASAEADIRQEIIKFEESTSNANITDKIKGDQTVDYQFRASAGQSLLVIFKPSNLSAYFNILPPGSEEAIFVGSTSGNRFDGKLTFDGVYTIRVYLMRNAARRGEISKYALKVNIVDAKKPIKESERSSLTRGVRKPGRS